MTRAANQSGIASLTSPAHRLITVIGAGGKTSLVGWLAAQKQMSKQRVISTTTTKIFPPRDVYTVLQEDGPDFLGRVHTGLTEHGSICVACRLDENSGKLIGLSNSAISLLHQTGMADAIIAEGDGAAHKPLKAPASHEPVIPLDSDLCIAVMGLDAAYTSLTSETVHRHEIFSSITKLVPGNTIRPEHMIRIATAPNGLFKGTPPDCEMAIFLNKSDIPNGIKVAAEFSTILNSKPHSPNFNWFAGSIQQQRISRITQASDHHIFSDNRLVFSHQF